MTGFSPATVEVIWERDRGCCAWCGEPILGERGHAWSVHHRRPRGAGGTSLKWVNGAANGVLLHGNGSMGCHGRVESQRDKARDRGFLVSMHGVDRAADIPIDHGVHGPVLLDDYGGKSSQAVVF